ncbi:DUF839 domain containing protein [Nitzschia inconspicua]|uniref:DUF839 domain containing protein n=1 Tax=Nitzschia inconspicua TaxID=303405 RepID=A0A9K3LLS1_9STRA|nr:DUF839 domain containing protein [Nitzschia inconspicua]
MEENKQNDFPLTMTTSHATHSKESLPEGESDLSLNKVETLSTTSGSGGSNNTTDKGGENLDSPVLPALQSSNKMTQSKWLFLFALLVVSLLAIGFGTGMGISQQQQQKQSNLASSTATSSPSERLPEYPTYTIAPVTQATAPADSTVSLTGLTEASKSSSSPTSSPSSSPSTNPTDSPSDKPSEFRATYVPGNLIKLENNLLLSEGLTARLIATADQKVQYHDGTFSQRPFHNLPDGGATFSDTRDWNVGGWIYVSNSEMKELGQGGVGAITFDKNANIIDYRMILENTTMNCAGGRTPWNTWVSCEEVEFDGQAYQVDPTGERTPEKTVIGSAGGRWEAFAYDNRDPNQPRFFLTEDHNKGTTRRFTPSQTRWGGDEWKMLHEDGVIDYLMVHQNSNKTGGTFEWTNDIEAARNNARSYFPQSEGIDVHDGKLYLVCKGIKQLFIFDLDNMTYQNMTTTSGLFDGSPDQLQRVLSGSRDLLYFTEEGGVDAGVHARDEEGRFFTILESPQYIDETTGLAFSPDGKYMYVAWQVNGTLYEVRREDGLPFNARSLNVKYHNVATRRLSSQWISF